MKQSMLNLFASLSGIVLLLAVFSPSLVFADTSCTPIYGGGEKCETKQLSLDKKVKNPSTGVMVENLTLNDPKYKPGETVTFEVTVTNTGNTNFGSVAVTDTLPDYLEFVSGPGSYNSSNKQLSYTIINLNAGASDRQQVNARVVSASSLPADKNTLCEPEFHLTNFAKAKADSSEASDTAKFCIQKQVIGVTAVPKTGASEIVLASLGMFGAFGYVILKKTRKYTV